MLRLTPGHTHSQGAFLGGPSWPLCLWAWCVRTAQCIRAVPGARPAAPCPEAIFTVAFSSTSSWGTGWPWGRGSATHTEPQGSQEPPVLCADLLFREESDKVGWSAPAAG